MKVPLKVLYLGMYWDYVDPRRGRSFEEMSFHSALRTDPRVEVTHFDYNAREQSFGYDGMNQQLLDLATTGDFDCLFCVMFRDELDVSVLRQIRDTGVVTIAWGCDDHWRYENYSRFWAPHFDYWVTTASSAFERFKQQPDVAVIKSQWAVEPAVYYPLNVPRGIEVSFVGMPHGIRPQIIQGIRSAGIPIAVFGYGWSDGSRIEHEEMLAVFSTSKICLNLSNSSVLGEQQIKGRVFEVPACGSLLLTDSADDLESYYEPGREVVVYGSRQELVDTIRFYAAHDAEREAIARAGYLRTMREHTWGHRFDAIFRQVGLR